MDYKTYMANLIEYNRHLEFDSGGGVVISHHGIKGQEWGKRKYQYEDGSLTPLGRRHYNVGERRREGNVKTDIEKRSFKNQMMLNKANTKNQIKLYKAQAKAEAARGKAEARIIKAQQDADIKKAREATKQADIERKLQEKYGKENREIEREKELTERKRIEEENKTARREIDGEYGTPEVQNQNRSLSAGTKFLLGAAAGIGVYALIKKYSSGSSSAEKVSNVIEKVKETKVDDLVKKAEKMNDLKETDKTNKKEPNSSNDDIDELDKALARSLENEYKETSFKVKGENKRSVSDIAKAAADKGKGVWAKTKGALSDLNSTINSAATSRIYKRQGMTPPARNDGTGSLKDVMKAIGPDSNYSFNLLRERKNNQSNTSVANANEKKRQKKAAKSNP